MYTSHRVRQLPCLLAFALLACLALATPSRAATIGGISDDNIQDWSAATWSAFGTTGVKTVRMNIAWDVVDRPGELNWVTNWLTAVKNHGLEPLISFNHPYANQAPPNPTAYSEKVLAFRKKFPQVAYYTAWNEPNHHSENQGLPPEQNPVGTGPNGAALAAQYWVDLNNICHLEGLPTCTVIGGDFLDGSDPTGFGNYMDAYKAELAKWGVSPSIWAIHPYSTVASGKWAVITEKFLPKTENKPVWFTEVGGMVCSQGSGGGYVGGGKEQAITNQFNSAHNLQDLVNYLGSKVQRTYYYFFSMAGGGEAPCGGGNNVFDSALLGGGESPRPAFSVIFPGALNPPSVQTTSPSGVTPTQATLNGVVDPRGFHTTYRFDYGLTASYGSVTPNGPDAFNSGGVTRSATISGLLPGTTYHYRVVASNPGGNTYGADQTFKTAGTPAESDVNGDHRSDFVTAHSNGYVYASLGTASGYLGSNTTSMSGDFDPAQFDGTGYYPIDVEDVNGDGYDDLVAIHSSGTVCTYLGQSDGRFGTWVGSMTNTLVPSVRFPGSGKYEPIAVADVNGDGRGDLIVDDTSSKTIQTYPGLSSGGFSTSPVNSMPGSADSATFDSSGDYFVDAADVNGDGRADLVSQNTSGYARTYLGQSSGGFSSSPVQSFEGVMAPSLATGSGWEPIGLGDVNGDGRADFVTVHSNGYVYTYLANPDGSFSEWRAAFGGSADSSLYDGSGTEFMGVLDMNGDGYADLVSAHPDGYIRISPGDANGYFGAPTLNFGGAFTSTRANHANGYQPVVEKPLKRRNGCAVNGCGVNAESDVNGDHRSDLVTLHTNGNVYVSQGGPNGYLGSNTTSFAGGVDSAQFDETGYYPVDVEDVNGDGRDDLVAVNSGGDLATSLGQAGGYLSTWTYSLKGQITPAVLKASPGKYEPIAVADVNGDGCGDFIAYNNSDNTVYTFPGLASGEFSAGKVASLAGIGDSATFDSAGDYFIDAADVNGDGRADLVSQNTSGYARTYLGQSSGGFSSSPVQSFEGVMAPSLATGSGWEPIGLGDVNGDGRADFVTAHSNGYVYTYMGESNGSFSSSNWTPNFGGAADSSLYDGSGIEFMGVLDINGDGFADMLTAQSDGNVRIYPGQANGYFGSPTLNFSGSFTSTRANHTTGFQPVVEKPLKRRNGCAASGCH